MPDLLQRAKDPADSAVPSAHQHSEGGDFRERVKPSLRNEAKGKRNVTTQYSKSNAS